jgi:hypothetical protein
VELHLKVAPFTLATCTKVKGEIQTTKRGRENTIISNTTSRNKEEIIWHLVKKDEKHT